MTTYPLSEKQTPLHRFFTSICRLPDDGRTIWAKHVIV